MDVLHRQCIQENKENAFRGYDSTAINCPTIAAPTPKKLRITFTKAMREDLVGKVSLTDEMNI